MKNPYENKAEEHFWKLAVAARPLAGLRPIPAKRFRLTSADLIATAGSCFAQHVSTHIRKCGLARFLQTEEVRPDQPPFSALYGNIYTTRQLAHLMEESLGDRRPADLAWLRPDGRLVDALRPSVFAEGFVDEAALRAARQAHIVAVRKLLSECTVFVFTLGLTEAWVSHRDGTVYPIAPGVVAAPSKPASYGFRNFRYEEVRDDLESFVARLKALNPYARLVLTVSPVPLTATYTDEHVLVATTHSKAILRAVCSDVTANHDHVYYFPSYEIIAGHASRGLYFADNLRTVKAEGVAHVMSVFEETYCAGSAP
ncbi:MAG TPA: GSCFA domain-containing protein, partial [Rhizomicrobium sp.]|nr:GSCFA domain-containing protein [Rhizomicrobium sp.]